MAFLLACLFYRVAFLPKIHMNPALPLFKKLFKNMVLSLGNGVKVDVKTFIILPMLKWVFFSSGYACIFLFFPLLYSFCKVHIVASFPELAWSQVNLKILYGIL